MKTLVGPRDCLSHNAVKPSQCLKSGGILTPYNYAQHISIGRGDKSNCDLLLLPRNIIGTGAFIENPLLCGILGRLFDDALQRHALQGRIVLAKPWQRGVSNTKSRTYLPSPGMCQGGRTTSGGFSFD